MVKRDAHSGPVDLVSLERSVQLLVDRNLRLAAENAGLRMELANLSAEHEAAQKAKNLARERVVAVLSRLKSLEE